MMLFGTNLVAITWANGCSWWIPGPGRGQLFEQRLHSLSTTSIVRALRLGEIDEDHNPPWLLEVLRTELLRRAARNEWLPPSLTDEEIQQWLTSP